MPRDPKSELTLLQKHTARLYGTGMRRPQVARALLEYLTPTTRGRPMEIRLTAARAKLRRWERRQAFRDYVYNQAVVQLDMETPGVLRGIVQKARRGRVDAARLVLEVTGRHNPKGETGAPMVVVQMGNIPRPQLQPTQVAPDVVYEEHEVEEVEDE